MNNKRSIIIRNRWVALSLLIAAVVQFALNWFDITACFGAVAAEMHLSFSNIGLLAGVFLIGYGVFHLPTGVLTARYGMQATLIAGCIVQLIGTGLSAYAPNFTWLLAARILSGVGGSIVIGTAIGLAAAWFRRGNVGLATSSLTGVAFTLGACAGIYGWIPLVHAFGWRLALCLGGVISLAILVMLVVFDLTPQEVDLAGATASHADLSGLRRVFKSKNVWLWGAANFGAYGVYGTAAQLMPRYAQHHLSASAGQSAIVSLLLLVSGLPASLVTGWYLDAKRPLKPFFLFACAACGLALIGVPYLSLEYLDALAALLGFMLIAANALWFSIPALYPADVAVEDIPAAIGLMLTMGAIGGFVNPLLFAKLSDSYGFTVAWTVVGFAVIGFSLLCLATGRATTHGSTMPLDAA